VVVFFNCSNVTYIIAPIYYIEKKKKEGKEEKIRENK
jgi:hypothetical protein